MDLRGPTRCQLCKMQSKLCICAEISPVATPTRVVLVVHAREEPKPTNTGTLAMRCLRNGDVQIRGRPGVEVCAETLRQKGYRSLVLFPDENAQVLDRKFAEQSEAPVNLIVPDGNWKQASRIPKRVIQLRDLPRVILPLGAPSEYRLRREPRKPHGLSTMEAIARALRILEGEEVYQRLMHVFRIMVERTLYTKGKLGLDQMYGGLPKC